MASTSYKGNFNIKRTGVKHDFTPEQIEEYLKCADNMIYFITTYINVTTLDDGIVPFRPYDYQLDVIRALVDNRFTMLKWPRRYGKMLCVETPILTPTGFVRLDDLKVGDKIYGPDGKETTLKFITEKTFNKKTYKVSFDNGDNIVACSEHLWQIGSNNWKIRQKKSTGKEGRIFGPEKVMSTEEIIPLLNHSQRPYITFTRPLDMSEKILPIDPYVLGYWLGDGYSDSGRICANIKDSHILYELSYRNIKLVSANEYQKGLMTFTVEGLHTSLRETGLLNNKHIPNIYLLGSYEQKLELVRGLMDSDGTCDKKGYPSFCNKNELLIDQFRTILASLGMKSNKRKKIVKGKTYFEVAFCAYENVFHLARKSIRQKIPKTIKNNRLYITSIEEIESVPMKCLQVDNESHLFLAGNTLIPTHNTTVMASVMLWSVLFNKDYKVAILAHKHEMAREILSVIQTMFSDLPSWLQQGVSEWNKGTVEFENGSSITTAATSPGAIRGRGFNWIYLDEFAHVQNNIQSEFYESAYPTITSGKTTKLTISSTPKGMNLFYKMWVEAETQENNFYPHEVHWTMMPGRDEAWKQEQLKTISEEQFRQEFECEFLGSSSTLIHPEKLRQLTFIKPIEKTENINIFKGPISNHIYSMVVDTGTGAGGDYSAFVVFDITRVPYEIVCVFRSRFISPYLYPNIINDIAIKYNNAVILVETQVGSQVADILHYDLEYENLLQTVTAKQGQYVTSGLGGVSGKFGIHTSRTVKRIGCGNLKTLIESDQVIINDYNIIEELTRFVDNKKGSFEAESGNDDLVMCLVLFSWLTQQQYFKDYCDTNVREALVKKHQNTIQEEVLPFGFIDIGFDDFITSKNDELENKYNDDAYTRFIMPF